MRFECACSKKSNGAVHTGTFSDDPSTCKGNDINFTPKCCFGCKAKDGTDFMIVVNAANEYADYGCNYDETDHLYLDNPKPPKPDDDNKTKPGKPDNNNTKPDNPDKPDNPNPGGGGGGDKPDKPKPDKPDQPDDPNKDKNGTHPGGGGGKPGDKDDDDKNNPKMDFSGYDKLTQDVEKGVGKVMGMYDDAKKQLMDIYDKIKNGSLSDFKPSGFVNSCPYTRDFVIKEGLIKKITIDICAVVKDARSVIYFVFCAIFSTLFSILLFKIIIRLV